jgi:microcystin degradation protein MlrC
MTRIAIGGILHETHTFAPNTTELDAFRQIGIFEAGDVFQQKNSPSAIGGILDGLTHAGYEIVPLLYASAMPSGLIGKSAYQFLLDRFFTLLANAMPLDGIVLSLHGAMVAEDQLDCEGEILAKVRSFVGPGCPVISTLDMHANVSPQMVLNADALVAFNTNPHLDAYDRGLEAVDILMRIFRDNLQLVAEYVHPPLMLSALATWTEQKPLSVMHTAARSYLTNPKIINVSILGGFAYADTPFSGVSTIVTTNNDRVLAKQAALDITGLAWENRASGNYKGIDPGEAVHRAMLSTKKPVILADVGDNIGGGTPGDGTVLLKILLENHASNAVVVINDAGVADLACKLGVGRPIETSLGGKIDRWHGEPVPINGIVEQITNGQFQVSGKDHFANLYGKEVNMGLSAVINCRGVRVIVTSRKTPPGDLNQLRSQGIEPGDQNIIVVKSAVAFRGAYQPIAGEILETNTPGLCSSDLIQFNHQKVIRPIYPLDEDHFIF